MKNFVAACLTSLLLLNFSFAFFDTIFVNSSWLETAFCFFFSSLWSFKYSFSLKGPWNFKVCVCLITGLTYMTDIKENVTILFTRKRKVNLNFEFWKSWHEPVQIKQWKQKTTIELRLPSCSEDKCKLFALFSNFLCFISQQSDLVLRQTVYSHMKKYQIICPAILQSFHWHVVRDFL